MSMWPACQRVRGGTFTNHVHLTVVSNSHVVLGPKRKGGWNVSILPRKNYRLETPGATLPPKRGSIPRQQQYLLGPFSVHSGYVSFMAQCPHPTLRAFPFPLIAPLF